ncbi:MAG: filamentous hemagglutinin N-terminal domain-containing protein, partial [Azovibrio sp.]
MTTVFRSPVLRPLSLIMALMIGVQPSLTYAQVVADPRAPQNQQPQVGQAANGVPVVNIQTPSAAGVSRNTYQQFDVNRQGVILNNAQKNVATQTSGWVQGNPNLNKGSARIILNEVNSTAPSQLRGYMEVAGSKAQLVIANPSGITCDGCGFINTHRATLTTGTPVFQNGDLTGYRVQGGRIIIEGQGLDARGTDYTDIISRAVSINSGLWAEHLNVVTGTNQVSTDLSQITPIAADPNDPKPAFALDVANLGGMYGNKIFLIGTEAGLGVINAGHIGAAVGDVIVTVDGRLESKGSLTSAGNTQITAQGGLQNTGTLYAQGNVSLSTPGNISNAGTIAAASNTSLTANNIQGQTGSLIAAGLQSDNTLAFGTVSL